MLHYYREENGDYLAINPETARRDSFNPMYQIYEGRATAITGLVSSICTTGISGAFLEKCSRVKKTQVPREWLEAIA